MKKLLGILKIYGIIAIGATVAASGVGLFLAPVSMVAGGLSGIGIILHRLIGTPVGMFMLFANIPLFLLGYRFLGGSFLLRSLWGAFLFSVMTDVTAMLPQITNNLILSACFGGGLVGVGMGLMFLHGATSGGTDIVAQLFYKLFRFIDVGKWVLIIDASIILLSAVIFGNVEACLYGIIAAYMCSTLVDMTLQGASFAKVVYIVSPKAESIAKSVMDKLSRGVTGLYAKGMYTEQNSLVLMCVIRRQEIAKLESIVHEHDVNAFIIFSGARKIVGEGFKNYPIN